MGIKKISIYIKQIKPISGKQLSRLADLYGLKRKTFLGIPYESDKKLRKRIIAEKNKIKLSN